jgi:uncharacterized protein
MTILPPHLLEREYSAIETFAHSLSDFLGGDLRHLWLFGSKARGDFNEDSDIDLLIVLEHLTPERRGAIRRLAAHISLDYDVLFNTHLYEKGRWDDVVAQRDTLWREVQRDGIPLHALVAQPIS